MRERLRWIAAVIAVAGLMTGCTREASAGVTAESTSEPPAVTTEAEPEIFIHSEAELMADDSPYDHYLFEERVEKDGIIHSYLTGEMVSASQSVRRSAAVMMSNDKEARPQCGTDRIGVVYGAPAEGTMNRYMPLIEDCDDLECIGSAHNYRTYYIYFVREFDAVYAHHGQNTFAKPHLSNVNNINGLKATGGTMPYRSRDRKQPYNAYINGERVQTSTRKLGYTQDYSPSHQEHHQFVRGGRDVSLEEHPGVIDTVTIEPGYAMNQTYFVCEPSDGLYHRYQYEGMHQGDEGSITAKSVVFQYYWLGYYVTTEYPDISIHTSDCGYFITGGKAIPISWGKDGEFGVICYYDQEYNGIVLGQGQTWVCIISTKGSAKSEIIGSEGA